jgi:protein-disulfide isomerase
MISIAKTALSFACGIMLGGSAVAVYAAAEPTPPTNRAEIEAIVRAYILDHPEILPEAMKRLEQRQSASIVGTHRGAIEKPFANAWAGNPKGDVVLVEFYDYACGYCRQSVGDVDRLIAEDKNLKVVFRELPVLGPNSEEAARVSLAAAKGTNFMRFHRDLYKAGALSPEKIAATAAAAGVNEATAASAGDAMPEIESNVALARALGLTGTPSFVVGDQVLQGAIGYDALKQAIADARAARS